MPVEKQQLEDALSLVSEWSVAIDAGANVGDYAIEMARVFRRVFAFEPVPDNVLKLRAAVASAKADHKVKVIDKALWESEGVVSFELNVAGYAQRKKKGNDLPYKFPAVTLDSFDFSNVGFMKIDVDGSEEELLRGATVVMVRSRPIILVETKLLPADAIKRIQCAIGYKTEKKYAIDEIWVPAQ